MAKPAVTLRAVKGSPLTYTELDDNFTNLKDATLTLTAGTGGTAVTADLNGTITLVAGSNITLTGNNTAKTITIASTATGNPLTSDLDVNGYKIISPGNGNIVIDPGGTGSTLIKGASTSNTQIQVGSQLVQLTSDYTNPSTLVQKQFDFSLSAANSQSIWSAYNLTTGGDPTLIDMGVNGIGITVTGGLLSMSADTIDIFGPLGVAASSSTTPSNTTTPTHWIAVKHRTGGPTYTYTTRYIPLYT